MHMFIPAWLRPLMGERETRIASDPRVKVWQVDDDDTRLPAHQQVIHSEEHGQFTICSKRREIIG